MNNVNMQGNGAEIPAHHFQMGVTSEHQNQSTIPIFPASVSAGAIRNSEDMATMDDYQFSASLDALLDSDHLVSSNNNNDATNSATSTTNASNAPGVGNSITAPGPGPGPGLPVGVSVGAGVIQCGPSAQQNTTNNAVTQFLVPSTNGGSVMAPAPDITPTTTTAPSVGAGSQGMTASQGITAPQGMAATQPLQKPLGAGINVSTAGQQAFVGTMSSITARLGTFKSALPNMSFGAPGVIPWTGQGAGTCPPGSSSSSVVGGSVATSVSGSASSTVRPIIPSFAVSSNNDSNNVNSNNPILNKNNQSSSMVRPTVPSKRSRDVLAVSEDEGERERRRQDRNLREQQRSHRITEQISQLREVLSAANIQFKPDKYSTLTKVVEYMKELQNRSAMLDAEHQKLIDTIAQTNEIVNNQYVPAYASGSDPPISSDALTDGSSSPSSEESLAFVRGIDYKSVFENSCVALALTSIDGRFLNCNKEFETITGYDRAELLPVEQRIQTQPLKAGVLLTEGIGSGSMSVSFAVNGRDICGGRGSENSNSCGKSSTSPSGIDKGSQSVLSGHSNCNGDANTNMNVKAIPTCNGNDKGNIDGNGNDNGNGNDRGTDTDTDSDRCKANGGKNGKLFKNLSLFNILSRDDMQTVFVAMSNMLRHSGEVVARSERNSCGVKHVDYWSDKITLCRNVDESFQLNVTLVRTVMGRPKFFDCALSPIEKEHSPQQDLA